MLIAFPESRERIDFTRMEKLRMVEMGREFSFCDCHAGGVNATGLGKMLPRTDDAGVIASRNNITIQVMY